MTESIDHQKLMDAFAALGDAALNYVTKVSPAVEITAPKTVGERLQEMEWEIHQWEQRWERIRNVLIANGVAIDDDTPEDHIRIIADQLSDLSTLQARVKSQQARLDTRDANADATEALAAADAAYERLRLEHNRLQKTHHEWVNGIREKQPTLSESIQRINDVVTMQIEALSPTSGTGRVVDIRRRRLAEHSIQDDVEHLKTGALGFAARSLITGEAAYWPWTEEEYAERRGPEQWLHAAAFLIAHYDAIREAGQES